MPSIDRQTTRSVNVSSEGPTNIIVRLDWNGWSFFGLTIDPRLYSELDILTESYADSVARLVERYTSEGSDDA